MRTISWLAAALIVSSLRLEAQTPSRDSIVARLKQGTQVRVTRRDSTAGAVTGKVSAIVGDTIAVQWSPDSLAFVSFPDLARLEVYERGGSAQRAAQIGWTIGLITGGSLYLAWCVKNRYECSRIDEDNDPDPYDDEQPPAIFSVVTLTTSVTLAALAYAFSPPEWVSLQLPLRVGVVPSGRGVMFYASIPW